MSFRGGEGLPRCKVAYDWGTYEQDSADGDCAAVVEGVRGSSQSANTL